MKISEMRKKLEEAEAEHGDLEIKIVEDCGWIWRDIEEDNVWVDYAHLNKSSSEVITTEEKYFIIGFD